MVYGAKAVLPSDILHDAPRIRQYEEQEADLERQDYLDALDKEQDIAAARSAIYQHQLRRYQQREVRSRTFNNGDLVLR